MSATTPLAGVDAPTALLVRTPRALRVLARLLLLGTGAVFLALVLVPWQQTIEGTGRVVAFAAVERKQEIDAPIEGRVNVWHVREGSAVKPGDPLVEVSDNDPQIIARLQQEKTAIEARRSAARARAESISSRIVALVSSRNAAVKAAASRVSMSRERTRGAQQALEAAGAAAKTAELNFDRQRQLREKGLASDRAFELADLDRTRAATETDRARASLQAAEAEELALEADRLKVGADLDALLDDARASEAAARAEEASSNAELARMEVRLARQSTQVVRSPLEGRVFRLFGGLGGEFVKAGEPLMLIVPDTTDPAVELWVDGNDVPLVGEGRRVRLQFEGWPAVQFTGWPSVAVGTFGGTVALVDAHADAKGRFRVVVRPEPGGDPWPSRQYLRQGVRVNGWVLLDQVKLGFELWRRFSGFPPSVQTPEGEDGAGEGQPGGESKAKGGGKP